jgi:hypothetical protein
MNPTLRIPEIQIKVLCSQDYKSHHLNAVWVSRRIGKLMSVLSWRSLTLYLLVLSITTFTERRNTRSSATLVQGAEICPIGYERQFHYVSPSTPTYLFVGKETAN